MTKIAVDAFGGDYAPEQIVEGALQAAELDGISVILTGDEGRLKSLISGKPGSERIEIVHAPDVIHMDEAAEAVRTKPESSLVRAAQLVREGRAGALVSAGSTGAAMAASVLTIRRIKGVERPAITSLMPTRRGVALVVDVGANVDCKPSQLVQFAHMGSIYSENVLRVHKPRVGLLNVGHEPTKGNSVVKEVYSLLQQDTAINFIGNIEGRDISAGDCDVIVCDGFVGNVVLKFAEGLADALFGMMKEEFTASIPSTLGALLLKPGLRRIKKKVDYTEYGGAPLLGVNGVVIIAHGGSNAKAICNAIRVAEKGVKQNIVQGIAERMAT